MNKSICITDITKKIITPITKTGLTIYFVILAILLMVSVVYVTDLVKSSSGMSDAVNQKHQFDQATITEINQLYPSSENQSDKNINTNSRINPFSE